MTDKSTPADKHIDISIVVPLFNESESVMPLYGAIMAAMAGSDYRFEILLIDDGSVDGTADIIKDLAKNNPLLRLIRFRRNFGQTAAMSAGIDHARGRIIVTMDGDLQNDPRDIGKLVSRIESGADIVVGWRRNRQDRWLTRKVPSRIANWLIGKVTGVPIRDNGCSLKAYRHSIITRIPLYSEMHRFIPAMASLSGAKIEEIPVRHHARMHGESKYGLGRAYRVLLDLLTVKALISFSNRPLLLFSLLALPPFVLVLSGCMYLAYQFIFTTNDYVVVPVSLILQMIATCTFLFLCGALGELVLRAGTTRVDLFSRLTAELNDD